MPNNPKTTILHVDDYDGTRYVIGRILRQAGFNVVSVANGEDCLQRAEARPSLIILDVNLPDINGLELCRRLKGDPLTAHIPVLHLSATCATVDDKVRGLDGGADGYLTEPVEPAELLATVRTLLAHDHHLETLRQRTRELERTVEELTQRLREQDEASRQSLHDTAALQDDIEAEKDRLQRVKALQTDVLSRMSHEFRTPLNTILALIRLLLERTDGELTPEQEKQVMLIRQAASDLSQLVNDVLGLVRLETDKLPVRLETFTVASLFTALGNVFQPLHDNDAVALSFDEPQALPPLYTDRGKVTQILHNLISNALWFTARGEVWVGASYRLESDAVVLAVRDTGIGIAPEDQERIFERFVQLTGPAQKRPRGMGLGLALCRELTRLLGGRISVQSQLDQGATFSMTIPRVYTDPSAANQGR